MRLTTRSEPALRIRSEMIQLRRADRWGGQHRVAADAVSRVCAESGAD
jgi:hypothetical protein